ASTIRDVEDSIAGVDGDDEARVDGHWLGVMRGHLEETLDKGGRTITRRLHPDRAHTAPDGSTLTLPGRSLMLVRNVGHLMTTPAVLDADGNEVFEGILDALFTATFALHDLKRNGRHVNSRAGSVYIVKPKMHGSAEVRLTADVFAAVEQAIGMAPNTLKIGIMDEERRTTVNLKACIRAASGRTICHNSGFMDRHGHEQ